MQNGQKTGSVREPLFHITRRDTLPTWQAIAIRIGAVLVAYLLCMLLAVFMIGANPATFFASSIKGTFGSARKIWKAGKDIAVLLCISLAVTPAFRMKFWNIGAEGQVLFGALCSVCCVQWFGNSLPNAVLLLLMLVASLAGGALWGVIPAIFKAKWNTNETLFTLMMNYVATYLVAFCLVEWTPDHSSTLGELKLGHLPKLYNEYLLLIIVVALLTVAIYTYLNYSKHGYELSVVGESENTARYIGINVKKVIVRTMILSGAICGLAGYLIVGGLDHSITTTTVGGRGFTAIMVSWLAKFNPLTMVLTAFLIIFLQQGASQVIQDCHLTGSEFSDIMVGIVLFFIIGCEFFIRYKINFIKSKGGAEQ